MKTQSTWKASYCRQFVELGADLLRQLAAEATGGTCKVGGLAQGSVWLNWRQGDLLCELVVTPWGKAPLVRIHGNRGLRWQNHGLLSRLGFFAPCPTCRRCRRVFVDSILVCEVSGHSARHKKWKAQLGEPAFELTCLQTELPTLAALAVGIASGESRENLLSHRAALKLLGQLDRQLARGTSYLWTAAAAGTDGQQQHSPKRPEPESTKTTWPGRRPTGLGARPGLAIWARPTFVKVPDTARKRPYSFPEPTLSGASEGSPGKNCVASWSTEAESELKEAGYRTAADFLKEFFGRPPGIGEAIRLGRQASDLCLVFGVEPKRLRKNSQVLVFWPVETLVPGSA